MTRLHVGCVAVNGLNAGRAGGQRERWVECHAPQDVPDDPAPRPRPARAAEG